MRHISKYISQLRILFSLSSNMKISKLFTNEADYNSHEIYMKKRVDVDDIHKVLYFDMKNRAESIRTLQELSRIAFRLAVGGLHFAARVAAHPKMAERVRNYLTCHSERI